MQSPQLIDTDDQIICKKHNSPVLLLSVQQDVSIQDQLLCSDCLSEKSNIPQSVLHWNNVKEMIKEQQNVRLSKFESELRPMMDLIQSLQSIIDQIKNQLMSTMDLMTSIVTSWWKQLNSQISEGYKYSINQELNIIINKPEYDYDDQKLKATKECNRQFLTILETQTSSLSLQTEFIEASKILCQLLNLNQKDENSQQLPASKGNQTVSAIQCQCSDHKRLITMINIEEDIGQSQKALCSDCKLQIVIPIVRFQELWIKYQGELLEKRQKKQMNLALKVDELTLQITQVKEYFNTKITNCIDLLQEQVHHGLRSQQIQQTKLNERIPFEIQQNQAEELSRREVNYKIDEDSTHNSELIVLNKQLLAILNDVSQSLNSQINQITSNVETVIINIEYRKITCQLSQEIPQHEMCNAVAFNKDGQIMAAGSNSQIKIWQLETGQLKSTCNLLSGHTENVYCLVFSKKMNWFASGGADNTIRCWKEMKLNNWMSSQPGTQHTRDIYCLLLTRNEEQLLSGSNDNSIKVWKVDCNNNFLTYDHSLDKHISCVYCIDVNESETLLVSCSYDKSIIIWGKGQLNKWEFKSYIIKSADDWGYRITFMSDNIIAWQQYSRGITHIFQLENGVFKEKTELQILLNQVGGDGGSLFPSVYNKKRKVLLQKHNKFVYIIRKLSDGQFKVDPQPIDCNSYCNYGGLTECGQNLVIWNFETKSLRLYRINYE